MVKLDPSSSLSSSTCGAGLDLGQQAGGSDQEGTLGWQEVSILPSSAGRGEGWAGKVTLPNLGEGCVPKGWKIPRPPGSLRWDPGYLRPGWVATTDCPYVPWTPSHPTSERQRHPLRSSPAAPNSLAAVPGVLASGFLHRAGPAGLLCQALSQALGSVGVVIQLFAVPSLLEHPGRHPLDCPTGYQDPGVVGRCELPPGYTFWE